VLLLVYAHLARSEERDSIAQFGAAYKDYRRQVPAFLPTGGKRQMAARQTP
jgi:methanethiol S-methyltransferase